MIDKIAFIDQVTLDQEHISLLYLLSKKLVTGTYKGYQVL